MTEKDWGKLLNSHLFIELQIHVYCSPFRSGACSPSEGSIHGHSSCFSIHEAAEVWQVRIYMCIHVTVPRQDSMMTVTILLRGSYATESTIILCSFKAQFAHFIHCVATNTGKLMLTSEYVHACVCTSSPQDYSDVLYLRPVWKLWSNQLLCRLVNVTSY